MGLRRYNDEFNATRRGTVIVQLAAVGLLVLLFNRSAFVLVPEGLLLVAAGVALLDWLKRYATDVTGPLILHNPLNQLFVFLIGWGGILGGFVGLWQVSHVFVYATAGVLFFRHIAASHKGSEARLISEIVGAYRSVKKLNPDKDEQYLLKLTYGTVVVMWGDEKDADAAVSHLKTEKFKSLHDVAAQLLIHRDTYTGSRHMKMPMDIEGMGAYWAKEERRNKLIDQLLAAP